jgi:hypothetical protein
VKSIIVAEPAPLQIARAADGTFIELSIRGAAS